MKSRAAALPPLTHSRGILSFAPLGPDGNEAPSTRGLAHWAKLFLGDVEPPLLEAAA